MFVNFVPRLFRVAHHGSDIAGCTQVSNNLLYKLAHVNTDKHDFLKEKSPTSACCALKPSEQILAYWLTLEHTQVRKE